MYKTIEKQFLEEKTHPDTNKLPKHWTRVDMQSLAQGNRSLMAIFRGDRSASFGNFFYQSLGRASTPRSRREKETAVKEVITQNVKCQIGEKGATPLLPNLTQNIETNR